MKLGPLGLAVVAAFGALACQARPEKKKKTIATPPAPPVLSPAEEKDMREEIADLKADPSKFLEASGIGPHRFDNPGGHYRDLGGVTIANHSRFYAAELEGMTDWLDDGGRAVGSTPFKLIGAIAPWKVKYFNVEDKTMTSGTINAAASKATVRITHVSLTLEVPSLPMPAARILAH